MTDPTAVAKIAEGLTNAQREALFMLPCDARRVLPSASFYTLGLHDYRRKWPFGPEQFVLSPLGLAVRQHLLGEGR